VSNQLDRVKKEITRLEVGIKSSERDLKKSKDKFEAYDAEVAELENKIREGKAEREILVKDNETLEAQVNELKVNHRLTLVSGTYRLCSDRPHIQI
jgi:septal ring factor EnvC (AmiA/AmiB activator)